jgi:hypothetical protein
MKDLNYLLQRILNTFVVTIMLTGCVQATPTAEKTLPPEPVTFTAPPSAEVSTMEVHVTAPSIPTSNPEAQGSATPFETPTPKQVIITGWFTTIWNEEPHYSITDDQGQNTELLLDAKTAKPLGGPLQLDRKRVTIVGEIISDSPRIVRVQSVRFADS